MADDGGVGSGGTGEVTTVGIVGFNVANQGTFGDLIDRENVSDGQTGFLTAVDILTGVHTFGAKEVLGVLLEAVSISETDLSNGGSSSAIMDNFFNDTFNITISFSIVKVSKLRFFHTVVSVGLKDTLRVTSSLISNNSTHFSINDL